MVSGAAGSVGHLVGQIAKLKGCRVVGASTMFYNDALRFKLVTMMHFDLCSIHVADGAFGQFRFGQ
eukprot:SAG31_NODE_27243_length_429_cov_0.921212_2_plen_66_part_00